MRIEDAAFAMRRILRSDRSQALSEMMRGEHRIRAAYRARYDQAAVAMRSLRQDAAPCIVLGQSVDCARKSHDVRLRQDDAAGCGHMVLSGVTGGGKSALALVMLMQLLALAPYTASQIVAEPKRDLSVTIRDTLIPFLVASLPHEQAVALASRFIYLDVFDPQSTVPFQVLTRDPTLSIEEQAFEVTSSFVRTVGLRDIGPLQETSLRFANLAALDLGLDVAGVVKLLRDEAFRRANVPGIAHEAARDYFERQFPRERASSLASLLNRLDSLLAVPGLRKLLTAPGMLRFPDLLDHRVVIIDLGGAPAGMREAQRFVGELMIARLVRSIFARPVTHHTPPVGLWLDEFQELLTPELASDAGRVLALARSKRCFLRVLHQSGAQFSDSSLLRIVRSQSDFHAVFRADEQDAKYLESFLPALRDPTTSFDGSEDHESKDRSARRALLEKVPHLPHRLFFWLDKRQPYPAILTRSATYPFAEARRVADALPERLRAALRTGAIHEVTEYPQPRERPVPPNDATAATHRIEPPVTDRLQPYPTPPAPRRIRLG